MIANDRACTPLPPLNFHGKEGVDGSSPSEGLHKSPANGHVVLPAMAKFRRLAGTRRVHFGTGGHSRAHATSRDAASSVLKRLDRDLFSKNSCKQAVGVVRADATLDPLPRERGSSGSLPLQTRPKVDHHVADAESRRVVSAVNDRGEDGVSQPAPLELEAAIDAPVTAVWDALVDDEHRRSWWSYLELDPRPGGRLLERWRDDAGRPKRTEGEVLEIQPHRLRCTWRDDWPAPTELQLELQAEGAATRVRALAPPTAGFSASRAAGETLFTCRGAALCFRPYHVYFARRRSADGIAARRDDPPETAVEVDVVALDLAGSLVLVEVERPLVVGDLERAVVAPDRPK